MLWHFATRLCWQVLESDNASRELIAANYSLVAFRHGNERPAQASQFRTDRRESG